MCAVCLLQSTAADPALAKEPAPKAIGEQGTAGRLNGAPANPTKPLTEDPLVKRRELYDRISEITGIPWFRLAAVDQYERTMTKARPKTRKQLGEYIGVFVTEEEWAGPLNPDSRDEIPSSIRWFSGIGKDGDGDGLAKRTSDSDLLYAVAGHLMKFGGAEDDFAIGVWQYYHNSRAVQRIRQFAKLYETFGTLDLFEHAFPLPIRSDYSYRDTWGDRRGWGGRRIHEGTDLFAGYGVPVRSTCYGVIEVKGWNPYGGWRIGIRDLNNLYHYYAHLSGFEKKLTVGSPVKPGEVIGWVGSSGYGKPGTSGKFPPHLHYGVYRDQGLIEWSFDPYPLLRQWEAAEKRNRKKKSG